MVEEVLGLEVTVDDTLSVHVGHGRQDLLDQIGSILLRIRAFLDNAVEELAARDPKSKYIDWIWLSQSNYMFGTC